MGLRLYDKTVRSISSTTAVLDLSTRRSSLQSVDSSSSMSSLEMQEEKTQDKPRKLLKFANLRNMGTTIRNDPCNYEYYYNPMEIGSNPYNSLCVDYESSFSTELVLDSSSKRIFLPDLPMQRDDSSSAARSSPIFESSSTAVVPSANDLSNLTDSGGGAAVNGVVRMIVSNTDRPIIVTSHEVFLKCFIGEYACFVDTSKRNWKNKLNMKRQPDEKVVKILAHPDDNNLDSHLLPFKVLKLELLPNGQKKYLTPGVYEFPFTFTVNINTFPSTCKTFIGLTMYRVESQMKIVNARKKIDTVILTEKIDVKRVLSIVSNTIKYESVNIEGSWNRDEFSYHIVLATKMIEMNQPFKLTIGVMKSYCSKMTIESIKVSLAQSAAIPCINYQSHEIMTTSYIKKNSYEIYDCEFTRSHQKIEKEFYQFYEIENLLVPGDNPTTNYWLRPFYCEASTQLQQRARLKITHSLNVQLTLNNCARRDGTGASKPVTYLTFRIPVFLVDSDMLGNLSLPTYRPFETVESLSGDEPPKYTPSLTPPRYT